jgi:fumarate hydratase subunit alpha
MRKDVYDALKRAMRSEKNRCAKGVLRALLENADIAARCGLPMCQDTGMAVLFIEIGQDVHIVGGDLNTAVVRGIRQGSREGYLRNSVVRDPILRNNTGDNAPPVIHTRMVKGNKVKLTVLPKGFGSENKSVVMMLRPTVSVDEIKKAVVGVVEAAGPAACPPFILGIGIGGTQDKAAELAKEALLRPLGESNPSKHIATLEREILSDVNKTGIGPLGLGGKTTVLAVRILTYPTHIAGLPVAINICCHALRSASRTI